jgi:hypothetical protein
MAVLYLTPEEYSLAAVAALNYRSGDSSKIESGLAKHIDILVCLISLMTMEHWLYKGTDLRYRQRREHVVVREFNSLVQQVG